MVTITPEMIEVGYRVLEDSAITDELLEADRLLVEQIFRAMYLELMRQTLGAVDQVPETTCLSADCKSCICSQK